MDDNLEMRGIGDTNEALNCSYELFLILSNNQLSSVQRRSMLKMFMNDTLYSGLFPTFNLTTTDIQISEISNAVYVLFDLLNSTNTLSLISGGSSDVTSFSSLLATYFERTIVSFSSTARDLSGASVYSNLVMLSNPDSMQVEAMKSLIGMYKFYQVAIMHTDDLYSNDIHVMLSNAMSSLSSSYLLYDLPFATEEDIRNNIQFMVTNKFRVVILWCKYEDADIFFQILDEMDVNELVVITSDALSQLEVYQTAEGTIPPYVERYLEGSLGFLPKVTPNTKLDELYARWAALDPVEYPGAGIDSINVYALFEYDALGMLFKEMKHFLDMEGMYSCPDFSNRFNEYLINNIFNIEYSGVTGNLTFNHDGDRNSLKYEVVNYVNGAYVDVGDYDYDLDELKMSKNITWYDGTTNVPTFSPTYIKIGGLFPTGTLTGTQFMVTFGLALDDLNAQAVVLPNTTLLGITRDTNTRTSLVDAMTGFTTDFAFGVVGPFTSNMAMSATFLSSGKGLPILSYGATLYELSLPGLFPSFSRIVPSDYYRMEAMARLLLKLGWRRIAIVTFQDSYSDSGSSTLIDQLNTLTDAELDVLPVTFSEDASSYEQYKQIETIKDNDYHVIVFLLPMYEKLMMTMKALDICNDVYECAFIFCDDVTYVEYVLNGSSAFKNETLDFLRGSIAVLPSMGDKYEEFLTKYRSRNKTRYPAVDERITYLAPWVYDAVQTFAHVFDELISQELPFSVENYLKELIKVDFEGYTGHVSYTEDYERPPSYKVYNLQGDFEFVEIGETKYGDGYELLDVKIANTPIVWRMGSKVCPMDSSGCRYEHVTYYYWDALYLLYSVIFIVAIGVVSVCVTLARGYKSVREAYLPYLLMLQFSFMLMVISCGFYALFYLIRQGGYLTNMGNLTCLVTFWALYPSHILILSCLIAKASGILYFVKKRKQMILKSTVRPAQLFFNCAIGVLFMLCCLLIVSHRYNFVFSTLFRFTSNGRCYLDCNVNGISYISQGVFFTTYLTALSVPAGIIMMFHIYLVFLLFRLWRTRAKGIPDKDWTTWAILNTLVSYGIFFFYTSASTYVLAITLSEASYGVIRQVNFAILLFCNMWMVTLNEVVVFVPILKKIWDEYRAKGKEKKEREKKTKLENMQELLMAENVPALDSSYASPHQSMQRYTKLSTAEEADSALDEDGETDINEDDGRNLLSFPIFHEYANMDGESDEDREKLLEKDEYRED